MDRRVKHLTVEGIQKRRVPVKTYVYILKVLWSDGTLNIIYRKCSDFFALQTNLNKQFIDAGKLIPSLKANKFSKKCKFRLKDGSCKRMTLLNKFCDEMINAPDSISLSNPVLDFCKPSPDDLAPQKSNCCCSKNKSPVQEQKNTAMEEVQTISGPIVFEQYIVVADYVKQSKNDINLKAGDIVDVIEKNEYGWWLVDCDSILGWAPASFLEPLDESSEVVSIQKYAPGEEELYQSMKPHRAEMADELSFDIGVVIRIQEKTFDGWWFGRYNGRSGWVPAMNLKKLNPLQSKSKTGTLSDNIVNNFDPTEALNTKDDHGQVFSLSDGVAVVMSGSDTLCRENRGSRVYSREAPMRRSKVQKSIKRKPRFEENKLQQKYVKAISEDDEPAIHKTEYSGLSKSMFDLRKVSEPEDLKENARRKSSPTQLPVNLSSGNLWTPTPSRKVETTYTPRAVSTLSLPDMLQEQESRLPDREQLQNSWNKELEKENLTRQSEEGEPPSQEKERPLLHSASDIDLPAMLYNQSRKLSWERQFSSSSGYDTASTSSQASLPVSPDINGYDINDLFPARRFSSASLTQRQKENGEEKEVRKSNSVSSILADTKNRVKTETPPSLRTLQSKSKINNTLNRQTPLLISRIRSPKGSTSSDLTDRSQSLLSEYRTPSLEQQFSLEKSDDSEVSDYNEVFEESEEDNRPENDISTSTTTNANKLEWNNNELDNDLLYQVISSYTAETKEEVSLSEGFTVEVLQQSGSGWWLVRAGGKKGWAPSNFLKSICADSVSTKSDTKL